ncbi:MAG: DUF5348 domain-containing protein [Clostridia bacterium]|nr:DUF5348 domain-containing protein [Clostridia bacterium]
MEQKQEQGYIEGELRINADGRFEVKNYELHCGACVQLKLCGKWVRTSIEAYNGEYYAVGLPGLKLETLSARIKV